MCSAPLDPVEQANVLHRILQTIAETTIQFPVSQILIPLEDTFDWLLDETSAEGYWMEQMDSLRQRFLPRWQTIAERALSANPRQVSQQALQGPHFNPLASAESWGVELTQALRAVLAEPLELKDEASHVLPEHERARGFARAMHTVVGQLVLPVLSFSPLQEIEWHAILTRLNDLIDLALRFEGGVLVWLIGGFARDVEGRLQLRPQVSFQPPPSGTRVKPLRILLGTAYEQQCLSLLPLVQAVRGSQTRPADALLANSTWHRLAVQLYVATDEYVLLNLDRLSDVDREMMRRVMYLDQNPLGPQVVEGRVEPVPRPWQIRPALSMPSAPTVSTRPTGGLAPQAAIESVDQADAAPAVAGQTGLHHDAEELRQKGMAVARTDPVTAQKYLLASTVLENSSVDVWLTLIEIATNEKQRASFRLEAEKVLQRQRRAT